MTGLVDAGAIEIAKCITGVGVVLYNNANARLGVGDDTTAWAQTHTDLNPVVAGNEQKNSMMATFPTRAAGAMTFKASFASGEANFDWEEWAIFNTAAADTGMLQRKVENNGTKTSGQVWEFEVVVTVQAA